MPPASLCGFLRRLCVNEVEQLLARENPAFADQGSAQGAAAGILRDRVRRCVQFPRRLVQRVDSVWFHSVDLFKDVLFDEAGGMYHAFACTTSMCWG